MQPNVKDHVMSQQATQKSQRDQHSHARELCVGQRVLVRNYQSEEDWIPGTVVERRGPLSYTVQVINIYIEQLEEMDDSPQEDTLKE